MASHFRTADVCLGYRNWHCRRHSCWLRLRIVDSAEGTIEGGQAMSESGKPKRRWFQFHLSSATVLLLVAGGIIWLNTISSIENIENDAGFQDYYETAT